MDDKHYDEVAKEPLLPFDKNATIHHLVKCDNDEEECKDWEEEEDSEYIMSEFEDEEVAEDGEELDDFDEITESDNDSGAEMVIENPFEEVESASPSGVKLEAVSLDNIITSGRRRNQQFF